MLKPLELNKEIIKSIYSFSDLLLKDKDNSFYYRNVKHEIIFRLNINKVNRLRIYFEPKELPYMEFEKQIYQNPSHLDRQIYQSALLYHEPNSSYKFVQSCLKII